MKIFFILAISLLVGVFQCQGTPANNAIVKRAYNFSFPSIDDYCNFVPFIGCTYSKKPSKGTDGDKKDGADAEKPADGGDAAAVAPPE